MAMTRRKIGIVKITKDDEDCCTYNIWGNVWSYNNDIWFGLFFNDSKGYAHYFSESLTHAGFKKRTIYSKYDEYDKYSIVGKQKLFDEMINYYNGRTLDREYHTSNGIAQMQMEFIIDKKSDYIYNEKVVDAI